MVVDFPFMIKNICCRQEENDKLQKFGMTFENPCFSKDSYVAVFPQLQSWDSQPRNSKQTIQENRLSLASHIATESHTNNSLGTNNGTTYQSSLTLLFLFLGDLQDSIPNLKFPIHSLTCKLSTDALPLASFEILWLLLTERIEIGILLPNEIRDFCLPIACWKAVLSLACGSGLGTFVTVLTIK